MRWLMAAVLCTSAAMADDAPLPPIRQFDLATIEKLGRAMYDQDQEAWRATDLLEARYKRDDLRARGLAGWIVDSFPDRDVVRFVRAADAGPEPFYDVTFPKNGQPVLSEPAEHAFSPEERAQYDARTLALKSVELKCSDTYNTVVLKDPEKPGWLVWVMAATTNPDTVIVGGHTRFTVSADGKTLLARDKLSKSCGGFSKKDLSGDFVTTEIVSLLPVESYVFASLSYRMVLRVETRDGAMWKINADMITPIDVDMEGGDGVDARGLLGIVERCRSMTMSEKVGGEPSWNDIDGVIAATEKAGKYEVKPTPPTKTDAVYCVRAGLVPLPNDYKVVLAGHRLFIDDRGEGHPKRLGELEDLDGQLRFRILDGDPLDDALKARIEKRMDSMRAVFQAAK